MTPAITAQPMQLGGSRTHHHVAKLYMLCDKWGVTPQFDITGGQYQFRGSLKLGEEEITTDKLSVSKKDVKEKLSETGLALLSLGFGDSLNRGKEEIVTKDELLMSSRNIDPGEKSQEIRLEPVKPFPEKNPNTSVAGESSNWVGVLQEFYYRSIADGSGPVYTEYIVSGGFACLCKIPIYPDSFGSLSLSFKTMKAARANAAKATVKYLRDQGHSVPDWSVKSGKKEKLGMSYRQRVHELCATLAITCPNYRLSARPTASPNVLTGAAYFPGEPSLPGQYGQVQDVYGIKAAKEECARGVYEMLKELAMKMEVNVGVDADLPFRLK